MREIFVRSFGGLSRACYSRHFVFGLIFAGFIIFLMSRSPSTPPLSAFLFVAASTFLYPYSRYVYESLIALIFGDNRFSVNAIFFLSVKVITIAFCWVSAVFVAPLGLIFLYFRSRY